MKPRCECRMFASFVAMSFLVPSAVFAQTRNMRGAAPLSVTVRVLVASVSGDTTTVSYAVENRVTSGESLWSLLVAAPAPITTIRQPEAHVSAGPGWRVATRYRAENAANWTLLADSSDLTHPGHSTPTLTFAAIGLPDTVTYWATPDLIAHPPLDLEDPPGVHLDMLRSYSDSGITVGISPLSDRSPAGLLSRTTQLLTYACGSAAWISSAGVCQSLRQKLDAASQSLAGGGSAAARGQVQAFLDELDAQHGVPPGKHVSDEAYWLLRGNAEALLAAF